MSQSRAAAPPPVTQVRNGHTGNAPAQEEPLPWWKRPEHPFNDIDMKKNKPDMPPINLQGAGVRSLLEDEENPSGSTHEGSAHDENAGSEGSGWKTGSVTGSYRSYSSFLSNKHGRPPGSGASSSRGGSNLGTLDRQDSYGNFQASETIPLLKASPPTPVGTVKGRYCVRIKRASLRQPFGLTFQATEGANDSRHGASNSITIAEDLPHLGVRKWDELVRVNQRTPKSVDECRKILAESALLDLVLQHREPGDSDVAAESAEVVAPVAFSPRGPPVAPSMFSCWAQPIPEQPEEFKPDMKQPELPFRTLLSTTRIAVLDESRGEFNLILQRASLKQRFGISFTAEHIGRRRQQPAIVIAEEMPHVGLCHGDRLVSINGIPPASGTECRRVLERSMAISLHLRRQPDRYGNVVLPSPEVFQETSEAEDRGQHDDVDGLVEVAAVPTRNACGGCWAR